MIIELIKYTIGGISSSAAEYFSYLICLKYLMITPYLSVIVGFIMSTLVSFVFNEFIVYKKRDGEKRNRLFSLGKNFMTYFSTGIILKEILLYIFLKVFSVSADSALIYILIIIAPLNYLITKYWAFKTKKV